jgi:CubicO group peptidase (beta-lactamase class C family)
MEALDPLFRQFNVKTPGCAIAVMKDGVLVHSAGYGMADIERGIPVSDRNIFSLASTTKQFTAFCIFMLEACGKLKLDDEIRRYVPEISRYSRSIRIRHLLHHSSGLRDQLELRSMQGKGMDCTEAETLSLLSRQRELNFLPGDEHLYCNAGYVLLAVILRRISGQSLRRFAQEQIFRPLGMRQSSIRANFSPATPGAVPGYSYEGFGGGELARPKKVPPGGLCHTVGDGNGFSSVGDLMLWNRNLDSGSLGGQRIRRRMHERGRLNNGRRMDYAGGLQFQRYRGHEVILHGGGDQGFRSQLLRVPSLKLSVACLVNADSNKTNPNAFVAKVLDHFCGATAVKPAARTLKAARPVPGIKLKAYVGTFEGEGAAPVLKTSVRKGKLWASFDGYDLELLPKKPPIFAGSRAWSGSELRFRFDAQGRLRSLREAWKKKPGRSFEHRSSRPLEKRELEALSGRYYSPELATRFQWNQEWRGSKCIVRFYPLGGKKSAYRAELTSLGDKYLLTQSAHPFPGGSNWLKVEPELAAGRVRSLSIHYPGGRARKMIYRKIR